MMYMSPASYGLPHSQSSHSLTMVFFDRGPHIEVRLVELRVWQAVEPWFFAYVPGFSREKFALVENLYRGNAFLAIFAAAFTPIPYKVFTIAAGVFSVPLGTLVAASALGRGARFFLVAAAMYFCGASAKRFLDRYLEVVTLALLVAIVAGFFALKLLMPSH